MPLYECVIIARNDISQQQVNAILDGITAQLEANDGAVRKREYWGLRTLAYRIKKNRKGHYALLGIEAPAAVIEELNRQLTFNEDVLRQLILHVDEIDEAPSPLLARKNEERQHNGGFKGKVSGGRFDSGRRHHGGNGAAASQKNENGAK